MFRIIMADQLSEDQIEEIRGNFSSCGEKTVEAIVKFRQTGDLGEIEAIVRGIVARYLPENRKHLLEGATDDTDLAALEIESLTLLEVVLDIQDAVDLVVEDDELRDFKTLGDVRKFLVAKVSPAD